jgi:hypothetical protein
MCGSLRRLQGQLQHVSSKLEQQQAAAAKAVAEECERHLTEERALQQQLQQLKSDLAVAQVCRANADSHNLAGFERVLAYSVSTNTAAGSHVWLLSRGVRS